MFEELFGGELDVTEVLDEIDSKKSQVRQHRDCLHQLNEWKWCTVQKVVGILKEMKNFCRTKKKMFLLIRNGIADALRELEHLNDRMKGHDCYIEHFEYHLRDKMLKKMKEVETSTKVVLAKSSQIPSQPASRSTSQPCKRLGELKVSPEVTAIKKREGKRPKTSKQPEEDLWMKKPKLAPKKSERPKRSRSGALLMKPSEGIRYAAILKSLKIRVSPEDLGIKIGGIRETRKKNLLVEVKCAKACVMLEEARALKLLKAAHINIGWFS